MDHLLNCCSFVPLKRWIRSNSCVYLQVVLWLSPTLPYRKSMIYFHVASLFVILRRILSPAPKEPWKVGPAFSRQKATWFWVRFRHYAIQTHAGAVHALWFECRWRRTIRRTFRSTDWTSTRGLELNDTNSPLCRSCLDLDRTLVHPSRPLVLERVEHWDCWLMVQSTRYKSAALIACFLLWRHSRLLHSMAYWWHCTER